MSLASGTLARAGLVVSVAVFASRVLGWLRTVVITSTFGAGPDLDAYFAAFRLPDLVFQLVAAGALASAVVPVLSGLLAHDEEARAWHVVSVVANVMLLVLVPLIVVVELAAPVLVAFINPGFTAAQLALTVDLTRLMLLSPLFLALGAVASSALNARGRFAAAAAGAALYNVAIIVAALVLAPSMGVRALAVGVVAGAILTVVVQVPQLVLGGAHYEATIRLRDPAAREALLPHGPAGVRPGRDPGHVLREQLARHDARDGCAHGLQRGLHDPPDPHRAHRGPPRHRAVAFAVPRRRARPRRRLRAARDARACACCCT